MDKKTDSKNIVMHVLITVTKGHTVSKGDAASQHVSEHLIAQSEGKKTIKKHCSARTIPVVTQHPFLFPQKGFTSVPGEPRCTRGKEKHLGECYSPASSAGAYLGVESFEIMLLTVGRRCELQNCQKTNRLER